jgi:hypothetical protein
MKLNVRQESKVGSREHKEMSFPGSRLSTPGIRRLLAFTLVEVLVASSILVLIIFAIYSSWTAILRASKVALTAAAEVQRSRIAIRAIEDALLTGVNYGENARYYYFLADTKDEDFHYLSLVSHLPPTFPGSGLFGDYNLRRVTFEVQDGEDGTHQLVMTQFPVLWATNDTMQPYPITLVRDLSLFYMEFWDPQRAEWMADFTATNSLPRMMRVTIGWGHLPDKPNEPAEIVTREVAIPSTIITGEIQRPQLGGNRPPGT